MLAHDLRNYLQPLHMRLELVRLRAQRTGRADDAADAEAASKSVLRLGGLVSEILDVARIDQGVFQLFPEAVDLGLLVSDTVFVSGSGRQGGLGLGLYLAKRIAAIHGGDLTVESSPGRGARFTPSVPLREGSASAPPAAPAASPRE